MDESVIRELVEIAEEEEVDLSFLNALINCAERYRKESEEYLSDDELKEILTEAISRVDKRISYSELHKYSSVKTPQQTFDEALRTLGYSRAK